MENEFIKETKIEDITDIEVNNEIIKSIIKTKKELDVANINFEYAEDELIDYYLYQIKANKAKLDYLLKKAKHNNLVLDMIEEIDYNINLREEAI